MTEILKKLAVVVFLTILIWAWAYLALEETMDPPPTGTLDVSPAIRQDLLVTFKDHPASVRLKLGIKGPPSQIAKLTTRLHASDDDPIKERLNFLYDPQSLDKTESHPLDLVKFLNESDKLEDLAVTVVSCEPDVITVEVEKLSLKPLTIQCLDVYGVPLTDASIDPASIQMFVRDNWTGPAIVILSEAEIKKARDETVTTRPFIELVKGRQQNYKDNVKITLPSTENPLEPHVQQPTIGYIGSNNFWDKYTVELSNESELRSRIQFNASEQAFVAYEKTVYQILIEILPGDETAEEAIHRNVIYNFPDEFVQKGEIKLAEDEPPRVAVFKLVAVPAKP